MDAKKMVYIRNAVIKEANSPSELMDLFNSGNLERHTGTLMICDIYCVFCFGFLLLGVLISSEFFSPLLWRVSLRLGLIY